MRIASAAGCDVALEGVRHVRGWSELGDRGTHVQQPAIARDGIDGEREVAHPQARVAPFGVVRPRAAPVLGQEERQPALRGRQIRFRVDGPKDRVVRDPRVEPRDQRLEEGHTARAVVQRLLVDHRGKCIESSACGRRWGCR